MRVLENHVLNALSPDLRRRFARFLHRGRFVAGRTLFMVGEPVRHLYFLESGAVSLVTPLAGGQTIEFALVGREGLICGAAALGSRQALYQASVQVDGEGYTLDVNVACQLAQEHQVFRTMIDRQEQFILAQSQQSSACNALHNVDQRLARWLLRIRDITGSNTLRVTQELMSELLGVRRTSISLVAGRFQHMGWISYARGHLQLENPEALERCACECHRAISNHYANLLRTEDVSNLRHRTN